MEKIGLIAERFTRAVRDLAAGIENESDGALRIGYCRSEEALLQGTEHEDFTWVRERGADMPERAQELLRNCDLLLCVLSDSQDPAVLPVMSARTTLIVYSGEISRTALSQLRDKAAEYGTAVGFMPLSCDNAAQKACTFYKTCISPETV